MTFLKGEFGAFLCGLYPSKKRKFVAIQHKTLPE